MSLYKRGKKWWVNVWRDGRHVQQSTGTSNRRAAEQFEAKLEVDLALGRVGIAKPKPVPALLIFAERFRKEMSELHAAKPKTISYYENGLKRLLEFEGWRSLRLDEIQESQIADYIAARKSAKKKTTAKKTDKTKKHRVPAPLQVSTINRELEVLRRMLRLAHDWKVLLTVPKISRLPGERQRDRILNHLEERSYLEATKTPLTEVATLMLETGMRPEEVFRIEWPNVHFRPAENARFGYIHNPFGKTKYARRNIPLTQKAHAVLSMRHAEQKQPTEGWVFAAPTKSGRLESLKTQHARAMKASKVSSFVLYSLRHTMLTRLGEAGADAFAIQKVAGHSSILISQRYVHPTPERIETAVAALQIYNDRKTNELNEVAESVQ